MSNIMQDFKRKHIIDQLKKHAYFDVHDKSYEELKQKLALIRATEIDITNDDNRWF